eukprot:GHVR01145319.1.p1 GENE.GHVR01145319.1~~GHVR01145319.1.p1  ORF type:complete len:244 (-),score=35.75 GHVR01145319.1:192-923(-)
MSKMDTYINADGVEMTRITIKPWQLRPDTMNIGFTGSAGTGKTTTVEAVNKYLRFPYITEGVRKWMKENKIKDVHKLEGRALMKFQMAMLDRKIAAEAGKKQFISDRTSLDILCYGLYYLSGQEEFQRGLMDYTHRATMHAVQTYDVIFTMPYGQFPIEDDGVRKHNMPAHQMTLQMLMEHSVALGSNVFHVHQIQADTVEDRVAEVMEVVDKMADVKAEAASQDTGELGYVKPGKSPSKTIH